LICERTLLATGIALWAVYSAAIVQRFVGSRLALREFDKVLSLTAQSKTPDRSSFSAEDRVDTRLWSEQRVRAYRESLLTHKNLPLAVLRIDRLNIRIPVFEGTDEWNLNRGVGWIAGTARPDEPGNVGIAGHRDGFFRGLKDLGNGDRIELTTTTGTAVYYVHEIEIVEPDNVGVLEARARSSLTLVTCYPFYFVGSAPQRFIVRAEMKQKDSSPDRTHPVLARTG
jgi:sortase A